MIPIQVNRVSTLAIVALALACAPANSSKQAAESTTTVRSDAAAPAAIPAAAPTDSDGVRADLARIQGSPSASVWVIEVSDFQCPFCKQWHDQTYQQLRDEYVKTGKVRLAYINFPLAQHAHAGPAAESAMCAGAQGKFWEMHDALFQTQNIWESMVSPTATFDSLANANKLDMPRWRSCVKSGIMKPLIQADHDRASQAGANATPSFMIGDQLLTGAQPIGALAQAIDSALAKTKKATP